MQGMSLYVYVQDIRSCLGQAGQQGSIKVTLNDVSWNPRLPCRRLSTGSLRRNGGEFVDTGTKEGEL